MKKPTISVLKEACISVRTAVRGVAGTAQGRRRTTRGAGGDISTRLDLLAERTAMRVAKKNGLEASVIAEESGLTEGKDGFLVIDAIDGTTNAGRGIPFYCCSIAYATSNSLSSVTDAAIINLVTGDLYWACAGKGSYLGSKRLHVSREFESVVGVDISGISKETLKRMEDVICSIKHVRQLGSAALELCFLAQGRLDACIDFRDKLRPTDMAAAYLIAKEAGAFFYGKDGSHLDASLAVDSRISFFAATQHAYNDMRAKIFQKE